VSDGSDDHATGKVAERRLATWPGRHRYIRNRLDWLWSITRTLPSSSRPGEWIHQLHDDYLSPDAGAAMPAYAAMVLVLIAAQRDWRPAGAPLTLGATAVSSIGVQKLPESWTQVLAGAAIITVYALLAPRRPFATDHGRLLSSRR
jgi:hypothetical protein